MEEQTQHRRRRVRQLQEVPAEPKTEPQTEPQTEAPLEQPVSTPQEEVKETSAPMEAAPGRRRRKADAPAAFPETEKPLSAKKAKDTLRAALKWSGVGLLFAAGAVASFAGKVIGKIGPAFLRVRDFFASRKDSPVSPEKNAQADEVTLEPTKPQEYKGMLDRRAQQKPENGKAKIRTAAMALLVCVALFSAYQVGSIVWRSMSTRMLSSSLSARYSQLSEQTQTEETAETEETKETAKLLENDELNEFAKAQGMDVAELEAMLLAAQQSSAPLAMSTPAPEMNTPEPENEAPAEKKTEKVEMKQTVRTTKYHQVGGDALPEMEALYQDNRDLIGWLRMEGILDLPVVYRDNSYYLTRDFYKNKSASGTLFLDENHPFKEGTQNLLLHGHNMKDGTMFGRLVQYETNMQFLKNNPFIQYSTLWRKEQYVIFAVLHVSLDVHSEKFFNYFTHPTFSSDNQFETYVRALQNRSVFSIPVDVEPSDALLTLSTCLDDDRLVIVARRLREGESKSEVRRLVQLADRQ